MDTYSNIVKWRKNLFDPPKGETGKDFIKEIVKIIQHFTRKTKWESLALHMLNIFLPLMLQKPSAKSKNKDHVRYLKKRLDLWREGKVEEIVSECMEIQRRLQTSKQAQDKSKQKRFTNLMMMGKVKDAIKLLDADSEITGVHELTEDVRVALEEKHPRAEDIDETVLETGEEGKVEAVRFEEIDQELVQRLAQSTFGSGGPTQVNADIWKRMLCSKKYGKHADELAEEIAIQARRLCTEKIPHETLQTHLANRLVPLIKEDNGIRPAESLANV